MKDLLFHTKFNIRYKYSYRPEGMYYRILADYNGKQLGFERLLTNHEMYMAKFNIMENIEEYLLNSLMEFIEKQSEKN
jgi:hypothetical protein